MRFPVSDRVIYKVNPLTEVICQIRFTPRLGIIAQLPVGFQEDIRNEYPRLSIVQSRSFVFDLGENADHPPSQIPENLYKFDSSDGNWSVTLAKDNLTFNTRAYERWEDFRERWDRILSIFERHYGFGPITRLGLRYQDAIDRTKLDLKGRPWTDLVKTFALGAMAEAGLEDVVEYQSATVYQLGGNRGSVLFRTLLGTNDQTNEKVFVIDADFFADEKTGISQCDRASVRAWLDEFHIEAGRAFRWSITDELHRALGPATI